MHFADILNLCSSASFFSENPTCNANAILPSSPVLVPLVGVSHEQVLTEKNGGVGQEQNLK
jgi:hypothetical protein